MNVVDSTLKSFADDIPGALTMSIEFTFALTGPISDFSDLMVNIEADFSKAGFVRSPTVYRVDLDERGVFDEVDENSLSVESFAASSVIPKNWRGLSAEFNNNEYTVYFLVAGYKDAFQNIFMEISSKTLDRLIDDDQLDRFLHLVVLAASNMNASAGFGTYELSYQPFNTEQGLKYILSTPDKLPSMLGLVSQKIMKINQVKAMALEQFEVTSSTLGYFILKHVDL